MDQINKTLGEAGVQKKLYRSVNDRWLYGVIGGLGKYLGVDSTLLRIISLIIGLGSGAGIVVYGLLALYLPEDPNETKDPAKSRQFSFGKFLLLFILGLIGLILFLAIAIAIFGWLLGYKGNY